MKSKKDKLLDELRELREATVDLPSEFNYAYAIGMGDTQRIAPDGYGLYNNKANQVCVRMTYALISKDSYDRNVRKIYEKQEDYDPDSIIPHVHNGAMEDYLYQIELIIKDYKPFLKFIEEHTKKYNLKSFYKAIKAVQTRLRKHGFGQKEVALA